MQIPIFVVSLKESDQRRISVAAQLNKLEIPFEFVDAVRGSVLSPEQRRKLVAPENDILRVRGKALSDSEIGCALSHLVVYQTMQDSNIEYAIVLEDDVKVVGDIQKVTQSLIQKKPSYVLLGYPKLTDFEVKHFEWLDPIKKMGGMLGKYSYGKTTRTGELGTVGYLISKQAAKKILLMNSPVVTVSDDQPYFSQHIDFWHLRPIVVTEDMSHFSTINGVKRGNAAGLSLRQIVGRVIKSLIRRVKVYLM
ncbi:MAG: glycosyltransferase family 25 protein [Moraxellaceae bacterium]|nr:glycosyltransferase family 25 protein [Moraxellaceae bacterium]